MHHSHKYNERFEGVRLFKNQEFLLFYLVLNLEIIISTIELYRALNHIYK